MGRRKRLLREKRKAKHRKLAISACRYRVGLRIKEYFRMQDQIETYLERLTKASIKREPLPMAVITYQAFRDSDIARELKDVSTKEKYDTAAWDAVIRMSNILKAVGWEEDEIEKFLEHSKELAGIE